MSTAAPLEGEKTLLILDDDAAFRTRLARALETRGFEVNPVATVAEATEIATKEAAVSNCYNSRIGAELTKLLGGSDRFQLTVNARVDAKSMGTIGHANVDAGGMHLRGVCRDVPRR